MHQLYLFGCEMKCFVPWCMTFNECETGERMYFSFTAICEEDKHPSSFGEHTYINQFYEVYLLDEFSDCT